MQYYNPHDQGDGHSNSGDAQREEKLEGRTAVVTGVDLGSEPDETVYAIYDVKSRQVQVINPTYKTDEALEDAIVEACAEIGNICGSDVQFILRGMGLDPIGARNRSLDRAIIAYEKLSTDNKFVADSQSVLTYGRTVRQMLESQKIRREDTTN